MHLFYIDDSGDGISNLDVFSALAIPVDQWQESFNKIKAFRRQKKQDFGLYVTKEWHAWKFISGRGRIANRIITKSMRASLFRDCLELITQLPGARLFNACFPTRQKATAFEWLCNRINRTLESWGSYGLLICDEGNEITYTKLLRKMGVFNPIPSNVGRWSDTGSLTRNIPIDRIIEDPIFKQSDQSFFIQLVDFAAYALLRWTHPIPSKTKYGLDKAFLILDPILAREARPRDPFGIIRPD